MAILAFSMLGVVAAIEIVLSLRWNAAYYTTGVPVLVSGIESTRPLDQIALDDLAASSRTATGAPLAFRRLAPNVIAFRESAYQYLPLMRGVIRRKEGQAQISVEGLANWYALLFVVVLIAVLRRTITVVLPYLGFGYALLYFIQAVRYLRVAKFIRKTFGQQ